MGGFVMRDAILRPWTIDLKALPAGFPTHRHESSFWERLGRAVATFGFLEEVLGKAIFSFTATMPVSPHEVDAAYERWSRQLERALIDPLGKLIDDFGKAIKEHPEAAVENLDELLSELRKAAELRNVLCHGSWQSPNEKGGAVPRFVDRRLRVFDTPIDCDFLDQVQRQVAELSCAVISSVTHMGWQFPGSSGPGTPLFRN